MPGKFVLGGFLISCLIKAGYYRLFNILRSERQFKYSLQARRKAIRELAETVVSEIVKLDANKDLLDRAGWKPVDKSEITEVNQ
tara:strand:+ start:384 stop:635 length:252 start_codon:yes stop_codon:yes gene_type:complete